MAQTPKQLNFRMPAEWEEQESIWLSWPHNDITWPSNLIGDVENSYCELVKSLYQGQKVNILVNNNDFEQKSILKLKNHGINDFRNIIFHKIKNVDAWIRDYGPIFVVDQNKKAIVKWIFNAWGDKYEDLKQDSGIPYEMNKLMKLQMFEPEIVLEGGSVEVNGTGTLLTTEQCLLNKNRNSNLSKDEIEQYLKDYLNISNILWLKEGIIGDDTDGHIDDIARFVDKNTVICAFEDDKSDENHDILRENYNLLKQMKDEDGNRLKVVKLPMPGVIEKDGTRLPASYANFYIGNKTIAVPVFGNKNDKNAVEIIQKLYPLRKVIGINCKTMVQGLGTLHCASQQEPRT